MENRIMYLKNMKKTIADELLNKKSPFAKIFELTGWSTEEIWMYIDTEYRKKHPDCYKENKKYFCWGETSIQKTR